MSLREVKLLYRCIQYFNFQMLQLVQRSQQRPPCEEHVHPLFCYVTRSDTVWRRHVNRQRTREPLTSSQLYIHNYIYSLSLSKSVRVCAVDGSVGTGGMFNVGVDTVDM